jgi:hypothetical protein
MTCVRGDIALTLRVEVELLALGLPRWRNSFLFGDVARLVPFKGGRSNIAITARPQSTPLPIMLRESVY